MKALSIVLTLGLTTLLFIASVASSPAQTVPQVTYGISFLGSGVYNQTSAVDNIFSYQFTTNVQLEADLLTAPGGGVSDYEGGGTYNLCGLKAIENALLDTALNCGKARPFVGGTVGLGRVQQGNSPTQDGAAFMIKAGLELPSTSGNWSVAGVVGYGDFGSPITGQSNKGIFFNLPVTLGIGSNAEATAAKIARKQRAEAKKQAKLNATMCKSNPAMPMCQKKS